MQKQTLGNPPVMGLPAFNPGRLILALRQKYHIAFDSGVVFLLIVLATIFAPYLTPYDPTQIDIPNRLRYYQ